MLRSRTLGLAILLLLVGVGLQPMGLGAEDTTPEPVTDQLRVVVGADGDARIVLISTYALQNDSEAAAFRQLQQDATAQTQLKQTFHTRLQHVANNTANQTGRAMDVTSPTLSLTTRPGTGGVVRLSVQWTNLTAQTGDRLILSDPFTTGFAIDRPVVVTAPAGYQIANATPTPTTRTRDTAHWTAFHGTNQFHVVFHPARQSDPLVSPPTLTLPSISPVGLFIGVIVLLTLLPALVLLLFQ